MMISEYVPRLITIIEVMTNDWSCSVSRTTRSVFVMFQAGIIYGGRVPLVPIEVIRTNYQKIGLELILQNDVHDTSIQLALSGSIKYRLQQPAGSPDMNQIEHGQDQIKRNVRSVVNSSTTLKQLHVVAVQEWQNFHQRVLESLIQSMPEQARNYLLVR